MLQPGCNALWQAKCGGVAAAPGIRRLKAGWEAAETDHLARPRAFFVLWLRFVQSSTRKTGSQQHRVEPISNLEQVMESSLESDMRMKENVLVCFPTLVLDG